MVLSHAIYTVLQEAPAKFMASEPSKFDVQYDVITPKGSRSRFHRASTLTHMRGAVSETAVKSLLQSWHPGTEISIYRLKFV